MENNYILILNLIDKTKEVCKQNFTKEGYKIILDEKNTILAKKENNKNINNEHEKAIINFIKCISSKYEQYGIIYIDLTKEIGKILKNIENIENIKNTDNNITLPIRQAIMQAISKKQEKLY